TSLELPTSMPVSPGAPEQTTEWPPRLTVMPLAPTVSGAAQSELSVVLEVIVPQGGAAWATPTCTTPKHAADAIATKRTPRIYVLLPWAWGTYRRSYDDTVIGSTRAHASMPTAASQLRDRDAVGGGAGPVSSRARATASSNERSPSAMRS